MNMTIAFDAESLAKIKNLMAFEQALQGHLTVAMGQSLDDLEYEAQKWMWLSFQNPQGTLEGAFQKSVYGPYLAELSNPSDYAWRREKGFTGMTDSLGRFYALDPGIAYMLNATVNAWDDVQRNFEEALGYALGDVGVF
jgi:hypothetical protein